MIELYAIKEAFMTKLKHFFKGYGSIYNMCPTIKGKKTSKTKKADAEAIYGDWMLVGKDIQYAYNSFNDSYGKVK